MMFLLDTMVVSDLGKTRAPRELLEWAAGADLERSFVSVLSTEEIELGVLLKERSHPAQGARLRNWFTSRVLDALGRVLPVDLAVARRAAALHVDRARPSNDARLAATALVHHLAVVTRDTADFDGTGVRLVNPYALQASARQDGGPSCPKRDCGRRQGVFGWCPTGSTQAAADPGVLRWRPRARVFGAVVADAVDLGPVGRWEGQGGREHRVCPRRE
jgi:predicted nucleic acid-binding protein